MPSFDQNIDLTYDHIRKLTNADGVANFFALLGYTIERKKYAIETLLSLKPALLYKIFKEQYIERLVLQDAGDLEIYLLESQHVRRKDLWQQFIDNFHYKNACRYLFVLARKDAQGNYQLLNFLLVERDIPTYVLQEHIYKQWSLPHISMKLNACYWSLEVNPKDPKESIRRSLCGFTYTEANAKQQHGKLMGVYMQAYNGALKEISKQKIPIFSVQGIFSRAYISRRFADNKLLKDNRETVDCRQAYTAIRELYQNIQRKDIEQTIDEAFFQLLEPILQNLGFRAQILPAEGVPAHYKLSQGYSITHKHTKSPLSEMVSHQQVAESTQAYTSRGKGRQVLAASHLPGIDIIDQAEKPLTYCLAYPWGRKMDGIDGQSDPMMPDLAAHVVRLLRDVDWVIVTNGKLWRLYTAKIQNCTKNFYEVNLADITALPQPQGQKVFQYFWLFFRAAAFTKPATTLENPNLYGFDKKRGSAQESSFLDTFFRNSQHHAQVVEAGLKKRVFDEVFLHFAEGFIMYARQSNLLEEDLERLPSEERNLLLTSVFHGTLTFLYRLLFLFYAEARGLLPASTEPEYYACSLESMTTRIAMLLGWSAATRNAQCQGIYAENKTFLYDELQKLFGIIDEGNPELHVPQYNGGLFRTTWKPGDTGVEAQATRFLAAYKIPDVYLALGLDNMARDLDKELNEEQFNQTHKSAKASDVENKSTLASIDYSELGVCQLGSIYEGLLEFKLDIPAKEKSGQYQADELFLPLEGNLHGTQKSKPQKNVAKTKPRCSLSGSICLQPGQRERKVSGSYYTPEYIVQYIVEKTIGPSLAKHLQARKHEILAINRQLQQMQYNIPEMKQDLYENHQVTIERFFNFRVLDMAAGSGHFLVAAIDYIAKEMMDQIEVFKGNGNWHIVSHELKSMRDRITREMQRMNIFIDSQKLDDITLIKRYILKNCIYGVDVNPMAVELTKVSLWLHCFTPGAPLVYLDHHIKQGNSLIGVSLDEVREAIEIEKRSCLFGENGWEQVRSATERLLETNKLADVTSQHVQASKNTHELLVGATAPLKEALHVYTSRWFSNHFPSRKKGQIPGDKVLNFLRSKEARAWVETHETAQCTNIQKNILFNAKKDAEKYTFFHWELEFPDAFAHLNSSSLTQNMGFDVVIGNPPYVRQEGLEEDKVIFQDLYKVYNGRSDLYTYFVERGHVLLRKNGRFGMITANKFMRASYGSALRSFLTTQVKLEKLIDFGDLPVFDDATTYPVIILSAKAERGSDPIEYALIKELNVENLSGIVQSTISQLPDTAFGGNSWSLAVTSVQTILDKLKDNKLTTHLSKYIDTKIHYGVKTGLNEAFIIDQATRDRLLTQDPKSIELIKPLLVGRDVRRYAIDAKKQYLIFTRKGTNIEEYKSIEQHLLQYKSQLEPKPLDWDNKTQEKWIGRKSGPYKWYEIQDNVAYYADFEKPKIIYPVIALHNRFAFDEDGYYTNDKTFLIPTNDLYLLSILNSSIAFLFFKAELSKLRGNSWEYRAQTLVNTPIRCINFITPPDNRVFYQEEAHLLYQHCTANDQSGILNFVKYHLALEPEASDIVHDLLAFLAGEMLRLNKEKQAFQKEFLDYLVSILKIQGKKDGKTGLDILHKGKAVLLNYPGDYQKKEKALEFTKLSTILQENQRYIMRRNTNNSTLLKEVEQVYSASVQKIEDIKAQLMMTDDLIDEVVYRLYRLTPEEMAIVRASKQACI